MSTYTYKEPKSIRLDTSIRTQSTTKAICCHQSPAIVPQQNLNIATKMKHKTFKRAK